MLALGCLIATAALPLWHIVRFTGIWDSLPALALIFVAFAWQANRAAAARERARVVAETERFLLRRQQLLQDAAQELRTPIAIALGRADLLAAALTGPREPAIGDLAAELKHELRQLQAASDRLLAAAAVSAGSSAAATAAGSSAAAVSAGSSAAAVSAGSSAAAKQARVCP